MSSFTHTQHQWGLRVCSANICWPQTQVVLLLALKSVQKWPGFYLLNSVHLYNSHPSYYPCSFTFMVVETNKYCIRILFSDLKYSYFKLAEIIKLVYLSKVSYFGREVKIYWVKLKVFLSPKVYEGAFLHNFFPPAPETKKQLIFLRGVSWVKKKMRYIASDNFSIFNKEYSVFEWWYIQNPTLFPNK